MRIVTGVTDRPADWGPASARVTAVRHQRFVEFHFELGDADLAVEMVLPYGAFLAFCDEHDVSLLPVDDELQAAFAALGAHRPD
jgi:hypothetical protein